MNTRKITPVGVFFYIIAVVAGGYVGYFACSGMPYSSTPSKMLKVYSSFQNKPLNFEYWNKYSPMGVFIGALLVLMIIFYHIISQKNFMFGKEYGTAKWADAHALNKQLDNAYNKKDKDRDKHEMKIEVKRFLRKSKTVTINTYNMRLSQNLRLSLDTKFTDLNNNILVIGGSGAGKSFKFVKPNYLQAGNGGSSFITTDPKGELMRDTAGYFDYNDYTVKVMDLRNETGLKRSTHYNPFKYVNNDLDILKLISNLMSNTTEKGASPGDPFWEKAEGMYLQAVFFYVWKEGVMCEKTGNREHNIWAVMEIINKTVVIEDANGQRQDCIVDTWFKALEAKDPNHQAVVFYNNSMSGAADTVRSVVISAKARMAPLNNEALLDFFWDDELDIEGIGQERTAVFCVIPDNDKTYNFVVGLFYTQCFQILYNIADNVYDGALPVPVRFMFDEFANVALPKDFLSILTTMRSRNISATIIIQNLAQIKGLFKDDWESISGNTDTFVYLGGNEPSTHEYVSKQLGKATIDKRSTSVTRAEKGSSSQSEDGLGRELMMPDEVRKMSRRKCIVLISGKDPVMDLKTQTLREPLWKLMCKTGKDYIFDARLERLKNKQDVSSSIINEKMANRMKLKADQEKRHYEYEKKVAEKTGEDIGEYTPSVVSLNFADMVELATMDIDGNMTTENVLDTISQREIEDNLSSRIEKEKEEKKEEEKIKKEEEARNIDMSAFTKPEEAEALLLYRKEGFNDFKIKNMLRLISDTERYAPNDLLKMFTPDQDDKTVIQMVDMLLKLNH